MDLLSTGLHGKTAQKALAVRSLSGSDRVLLAGSRRAVGYLDDGNVDDPGGKVCTHTHP